MTIKIVIIIELHYHTSINGRQQLNLYSYLSCIFHDWHYRTLLNQVVLQREHTCQAQTELDKKKNHGMSNIYTPWLHDRVNQLCQLTPANTIVLDKRTLNYINSLDKLKR